MKLSTFAARVLLVVLILLAFYLVGWSLGRIGTVVKMLALACLSAYLVNPLVKRLQSRGMRRGMAIAAVFLTLLTAVAAVSYALLPVALRQLNQIGRQVTDIVASSETQIARLQVILSQKLPGAFMEGRDLPADFRETVAALTRQVVDGATEMLVAVAANAIYAVLMPMVAFLLLLDGPEFYLRLVNSVPNRYFEVAQRLITRIDDQLGGFIRGILVVTFCVGVVSTAGLWLCGMKYFFVLGPFMGLLNMIPIFGPAVGMAVAALAMLMQTGELGTVLGPLTVGLTAQVLDNVFFTPVAMSRSVNLHPLLVLVITLVGGQLVGLLGLILAVPATGTVKVIWQAVREAQQSQLLAASVKQ
ncbi:MAG: AI-2E family transporter [Gemmatimonadota bacterium]